MSYDIIFSDTAFKQMGKLPKDLQERIVGTLQRCRIRPHHHAKKLVGNPYYSLRAGEYRIIIDIKNKELIVYIIVVGHRKNIYK